MDFNVNRDEEDQVTNQIEQTIEYLKNNTCLLEEKQVTVGFDGFIDCIVRLVRRKDSSSVAKFFEEISEFGLYIVDKENKSFGIEYKQIEKKIGGNMPIMANAIGQLGINVNCIGAMGFPKINDVFETISNNCTIQSIAEPGETIALEFDNGKIILSRTESIDKITWEIVKRLIGYDSLERYFFNHDFFGMVNWSELDNCSDIWRGILDEVLSEHKPNKQQVIFFDMADCSKREKKDIRYAIRLIEKFSDHYKVILSLNENESHLIYDCLNQKNRTNNLDEIGHFIYNNICIDVLVIHHKRFSVTWHERGTNRVKTFFTDKPVLTTGVGDNFNAGICIGQLMELNMEHTLILANAVASYYVRNGQSPSINQLIRFLNENEVLYCAC